MDNLNLAKNEERSQLYCEGMEYGPSNEIGISDRTGFYKLSDGSTVPGVTQVLDLIVPPRLKTAISKRSYNANQKMLFSTGAEGKKIEQLCTLELLGGETARLLAETVGEFEYQRILEQWVEFRLKHKITAIQTQLNVWSQKFGYAGSLDLYGNFDSCGNKECCYYDVHGLCVMDFKSGFYSKKAALQMAAYAQGLNDMTKNSVVGVIGLQVHRDGRYPKAFVTKEVHRSLKRFLYCLEIFKNEFWSELEKRNYHWLTRDSAEEYLKERIEYER